MSKKYTIEYIKNCFNKENYILLTKIYINSNQKLDYICPNGHRHSISFSKWLSGRRCSYCYGNHVLSQKFVEESFSEEGYELLSKYKNNKTLLYYICPHGHKGSISWAHWNEGHRCAECAKNKKLNISFIKLKFEEEGYELFSKKYFNSKQKLKYKCPKGHFGSISWNNWSQGVRCAECAGKVKKTVSGILGSFTKEGYVLITDFYKNCHQKLHLICPKGHDYYVSWDNWKNNNSRCPRCGEYGTSHQELELFEFLKEICNDTKIHDRSLISPFELDFIIPSKKIAIEYCGLYWHSELAGKNQNYHLNKLNLCDQKGYRLITIFEDEWLFKKDVVKSRLNNIFDYKNNNVIYARRCEIGKISAKQARIFCENNHLQGYAGSKNRLGAFYGDELVSVMTFSKPSISKGNDPSLDKIWELNRFCSKINYRVVGIASKLLKYFENNYEWNEIFSYADRRWSDGKLYEKTEFKFDKKTKPNYWYFKGQKRIHRFALRKTEKDLKSNNTEWEIRKSQGYNRIWDCGNLKYIKFNI